MIIALLLSDESTAKSLFNAHLTALNRDTIPLPDENQEITRFQLEDLPNRFWNRYLEFRRNLRIPQQFQNPIFKEYGNQNRIV